MNLSFSFENPLKSRFDEQFFKSLPQEAGVYFFLDQDREPLYIGKADCLKKRVSSYRSARPGYAPEHILEMIEHAHEITWETYSSGSLALRRESELIRSLQPPFNIAGTDPIPFLFLGMRQRAEKNLENFIVDFRLSHKELPHGFVPFGCFLHRGKTKAGYAALLRLFFAVTCQRERFHLPAKLCRTTPPYVHSAEVPSAWYRHLVRFLKGDSQELLRLMTKKLLEKESLPPYLYAPLQRDLMTAKEFYESCPLTTKKIRRQAGLKSGFVPQLKMEQLTKDQAETFIRNLPCAPKTVITVVR